MNESQARAAVKRLLSYGKCDAMEARVTAWSNGVTRLADNLVTQNVATEATGVRVECAYGRRNGSASTTDLSDGSLRSVVRRAEAIARVSRPDPEYMPPVTPREAGKYLDIRSYSPETAALGPMARARELAHAIARVKGARMRLSGAYTTGWSLRAFGNSAGLMNSVRSTGAEVHLTVLGRDGSGWAQEKSFDARDIDVARVGQEAMDIARQAQKAGDLPAGKYEVILKPAAVAELLDFVIYDLDAKAADEGRSFVRGKLGTRLFGENVTVRTDPVFRECPGSPVSEAGLASRPTDWIRNGRIANLSYSRYWAKKKGKRPTPWMSNVIMDGGNETVESMIRSTERGLLVTRFWYIRHVDPMVPSVTGMTRDGLFLIENGKIARPVRQMRFNVNLVEVFSNVTALGQQVRTGEYASAYLPTIKVRDFNFTSTTRF
jgi:predicted Zn-dependent protease